MPISSSETPSSAAEDFGPYFFAWADEGDAFDAALHTRFDDDIFEFNIEQQEGDFASLSISIKNPRIGLLAPGRQVWAWFSWWDGIEAVPLFFGRLVGLPENLADESVTLNFIARPTDFAAQKATYADTLKVRPFWDAIWFDSTTRDNPDNVLESRPEAWHIDRVTHVVTSSNIIDGEDGTAAFDEDTVFYDSVKVSYSQNPLRSVTMTAQVSWDQAGSGTLKNFSTGSNLAPAFTIQSYTGTGLAAAWPKPGDSIGGGWSFVDPTSVSVSGALADALIGEIQFNPVGISFYVDGGFDTSLGTFEDLPDGTHIGFSYHVAIPNITLAWKVSLGWEVNRRKTENLTFTLTADVQDIITLADDGEVLNLTMQTSEVTNAVDSFSAGSGSSAGGVIPIGTPLARSYFNTDRGAESIEYLISVARAHLLARARCVKIDFEMKFEDFVSAGITLRKNATLADSRLPGTNVGGKIIAYNFGLSNGAQFAQISIGCCIGKDGTQSEIGGTPDWVDEGYVDTGYQTYSGQFNLPPGLTDVTYTDQSNVQANDDGIIFPLSGRAIKRFQLLNPNGDGETQQDALDRFTIITNPDLSLNITNTTFAQITLQLPDLTAGPFETDYLVQVSDLKVPRGIDLEAPSEGASS